MTTRGVAPSLRGALTAVQNPARMYEQSRRLADAAANPPPPPQFTAPVYAPAGTVRAAQAVGGVISSAWDAIMPNSPPSSGTMQGWLEQQAGYGVGGFPQAGVPGTFVVPRSNMPVRESGTPPPTPVTTLGPGTGDEQPLPGDNDADRALQNALDALALQQEAARLAMEEAVAAGEAEVAAEYADRIAEIEGQIGEITQARDAYNTGVTKRNELVGFYNQQAQSVAPVSTEGVAAAFGEAQVRVDEAYGVAFDNTNAMLEKVGADNPALAQEFGDELNQFKGMIDGALRADVGNAKKLLVAADGVARAMEAQAAASDMKQVGFDAAVVNAELKKAITSREKTITGLVKSRDKAIATIRTEADKAFGFTSLSFDDKWDAAVTQFSTERGWTQEQTAEFVSTMQGLRTGSKDVPGVKTRQEAEQLIGSTYVGQVETVLQDFMDELGLPDTSQTAVWTWFDGRFGGMPPKDQAISLSTLLGSGGFSNELLAMGLGDALNTLPGTAGLQTADKKAMFDTIFAGAGKFNIEDYDDELALFDLWSAVEESTYNSKNSLQSYLDVNGIGKAGVRVARDDLTPVSNGRGGMGYLLPPAADAFTQMVVAASAPNSINPKGVQLMFGDSYREWDDQQKAYDDFRVTGKNQAGTVVPNILPPEKSKHTLGLAVDFNIPGAGYRDNQIWQWLNTNGRQFGWFPISSEPWHWEYRGVSK